MVTKVTANVAGAAGLRDAVIPPGVPAMYGGASAPSGWLFCDGAAVSRTTYAALFAAIGTTFGAGDGLTTFNLPDFRGRSPLGVGQGNIAEGGTNSVIRNVDGYRTENRGTATLLNGTASIVVNHGLANTPELGDILVTPQTSDGSATQFWISTATATTFTILMDADPGKNVPFSWHAQIN